MTHLNWQPVIGLELHVQLNTRSKLFCADEVSFAGEPNTRISEISLGYPGTLPVLNAAAIEKAVLLGLACGCSLNTIFFFERKNYTYPDLPKGYQLTQSRLPVCRGGSIPVRSDGRYVGQVALNRIQLEEDAGKSLHDVYASFTAIDFNRAGTPLLEVVTEPVIHSAEQAGAVVAELRRMVRYLNISDGNMEEASLRCDANISVRKAGTNTSGSRVEIKNLNSIRFLQQALTFEIQRQIELLENGQQVVQETRLFDPSTGQTFAMRTKEELNDYRYFPEPDLPAIKLDNAWIEKCRRALPEMPDKRYTRYVNELQLSPADAALIAEEKGLADLFDQTFELTGNARKVANWVVGPVRVCFADTRLMPDAECLADVIQLVDTGRVAFAEASRQLLPFLLKNSWCSAEQAAEHLGIFQTSNQEDILPIVQHVLDSFPDKVMAYQKGKKGLIGFFMGQIQKHTNSLLNPAETRVILERLLRKEN